MIVGEIYYFHSKKKKNRRKEWRKFSTLQNISLSTYNIIRISLLIFTVGNNNEYYRQKNTLGALLNRFQLKSNSGLTAYSTLQFHN